MAVATQMSDGEWEVSRRGWKAHKLTPDDAGLPEGHRFGYFLRRNVTNPKLNQIQAFCLCKWRAKDPLTGRPAWKRGGKKAAMYQYTQEHLKPLLNQGTIFDSYTELQSMRSEMDSREPVVITEHDRLIASGDWIDAEF
jgi:hypothetical protein